MGGSVIPQFTDDDEVAIFYSLKDAELKPVATVCLMPYKDRGWYARGISIRSKSDHIDREEGRLWARERALKGHQILARNERDPDDKRAGKRAVRALKQGRILPWRFIGLEPIKRIDVLSSVTGLALHNRRTGAISAMPLPTLFKVSTFPEQDLTSFERELISRVMSARKRRTEAKEGGQASPIPEPTESPSA